MRISRWQHCSRGVLLLCTMLKKSFMCPTLGHSSHLQMLHSSIVVAGYCALAEKRYLEINKGQNEQLTL